MHSFSKKRFPSLADSLRPTPIFCIFTSIITAFAAYLRCFGINYPKKLMFDETYYVKDAWTQLKTLSPREWEKGGDASFIDGSIYAFKETASFVVHPPFGKMIIGSGIQISQFLGFGGANNSASWRISEAVLSTFSVLLIIIVAKKLFSHFEIANNRIFQKINFTVAEFFALLAGIFYCFDGLSITMGRIGILDMGLSFFVLLAFYYLLNDWDDIRNNKKRSNLINIILCSISLGLAFSVKWSAAYYCVFFSLFIVHFNFCEKEINFLSIKSKFEILFSKTVDSLKIISLMAFTVIVTYFVNWAPWFTDKTAWGRSGSINPKTVLGEFYHYHEEMWNFHTHLETVHSYASKGWTWLFAIRPVSFFYESENNGIVCASNHCSSAMTALPNPILWWLCASATVCMIILWITNSSRLKENLLLLISLFAGIAPWALFYVNRTAFFFYSIIFEPYYILILCSVLFTIFSLSQKQRKAQTLVFILGITAIICVVSIYFMPIWNAKPIPYSTWYSKMWLKSWI